MSKENYLQQTQSVLSIGYLYLIVMGILNETLFYSQIGVDILKYSTILDVLISPIARIAEASGMFFFLVLIISSFILPRYLTKYKDKKWFQIFFKQDGTLGDKETQRSLFNFFIMLTAMGLFGFFVGAGAGGGQKVAKKIENNEIEYNDKLSLLNGENLEVEILGKNSSYLFYLTQESKTVKVSPINGTVKSIEEVEE